MRIIIAEAGKEYRIASEHKVKTPEDAAREGAPVRESATECFCVLCLDARNGMRAAEIVTNGLVDSSLVHPREVFRPAIARNAARVVLVHNHPTGDVTPSAEDIRATKQLVAAGEILDIAVLDHVIIGPKAGVDGMPGDGVAWLSMREEGIVIF